MTEVKAKKSPVTNATRMPFDLSPELSEKAVALNLMANIDQMRDEGFTVIPNIASDDFTARLRDVCIRMTEETEGLGKGKTAALLLGRDGIFEEVVLNPKIQVMVEVMCGKGALLSQMIASNRDQGAPALPIHVDQNWTPAPFPEHNQIFTMCWTMDEFTEESGCTKVIPRTHLLRRHPTDEESKLADGAVPVICPANSLACWNGSVWHGNYPRKSPGNRVVLHTTFSRLALRPVENYDHLDEAWLQGKPYELRVMLGREDMFGTSTIARGFADHSKIPNTFSWAKT